MSKQRPARRRTINIRPQPLCAGSGLNEERLQIRIRISNSPALAPAHALALIREMQQFAVEAAAPRAQNAGVVGAGGEAEQFADGEDEADVARLGVGPDGEGEVEAVGRAAAGGEGAAEAEAGGGAPAGVGAEGRVAGPDAAEVGEEGGAEVEHLAERPAEVDAVLEREDGTATAGEPLGCVAAQRVVAAERELE